MKVRASVKKIGTCPGCKIVLRSSKSKPNKKRVRNICRVNPRHKQVQG